MRVKFLLVLDERKLVYMGVKIEKAIHINTGTLMTNKEADKSEMSGEKFVCPFCKAHLIFRRTSKRILDNKEVLVLPYYRLKNGNEHKDDCEYNTFGKIEIIARKSISLKDFMEKENENKYAVRLQIVKEALKDKTEAEEAVDEHRERDGDVAEKIYKNRGKMAPYLSQMKDIMVLRSKMEGNADIKKHLSLKYKSETITWDNFYFGPEAEEYIALSNYNNREPKPQHPVCIEGTIKEYVSKEDKNQKLYYEFQLSKPFIKDTDKNGYLNIPNVSIKVYAEQAKLLTYMKSRIDKGYSQVVVYGNPWVWKNENKDKKIRFHSIIIWVNRIAQIHLFNDVY